jgi:NAD+ synthetase
MSFYVADEYRQNRLSFTPGGFDVGIFFKGGADLLKINNMSINYKNAIGNIHGELKTYLQNHEIKSLILGVSGGMDSCLVAALAKPVCDDLEIPLIGRSLPITTNTPDEIERAQITGKAFCTNFERANLGEIYNHLSILNPEPQPQYKFDEGKELMYCTNEDEFKAWRIRSGNIKARLRMIYLYHLASQNNGMVLSTDNYTEYLLGFWTLHGDVGDYGMIQELWKSEVYDMAEWIKDNECNWIEEKSALELTINALATDGLGVTSKGDLGQILPDWEGSSRDGYREVDRILQNWEKPPSFERTAAEILYEKSPIIQRHLRSGFKRNNPINIKRPIILYGPSSK